jgi:peptide chain release factor 1
MIPIDLIQSIQEEYDELKDKVVDPSLMGDQRTFKKISKRFNELSEIIQSYEKLKSIENEVTESKEMIRQEKDQEMIDLAKEELEIGRAHV